MNATGCNPHRGLTLEGLDRLDGVRPAAEDHGRLGPVAEFREGPPNEQACKGYQRERKHPGPEEPEARELQIGEIQKGGVEDGDDGEDPKDLRNLIPERASACVVPEGP